MIVTLTLASPSLVNYRVPSRAALNRVDRARSRRLLRDRQLPEAAVYERHGHRAFTDGAGQALVSTAHAVRAGIHARPHELHRPPKELRRS
jgi:hypothetical protein